MVAKRGRVLRDTNVGPGLVTVDGKQYTFTIEDMWLSEVPARSGMVVEVTFAEAGVPLTLRAVPESQIAREQAQTALANVQMQGSALASGLRARYGTLPLIAFAALIVGWFFLDAISLGGARVQFTFWQLLSYVGNARALLDSIGTANNPGSGIFSLLAFLALAGPVLRFFWSDRRAQLAGSLPLLLMLLVGWEVRSGILQAITAFVGTGPQEAMARDRAWTMFLSEFSLASGVYLSFLASIYFAVSGTRQYLLFQPPLQQPVATPVATA